MSDRMYVSTRKGLFTVERRDGADSWHVSRSQFLGDTVELTLPDPRDGSILVALLLGHFGPKLQRSTDRGESFQEVATPAYPPQPEEEKDVEPAGGREIPWSTKRIWSLEPGGEDELLRAGE